MQVRIPNSFGKFCSKGEQRNGVIGGGGCGVKKLLFLTWKKEQHTCADGNDLVKRESLTMQRREERIAGVTGNGETRWGPMCRG